MVGPDGNVYITTANSACVYQVNATNGTFNTYIPYVAGSLAKYLAFACNNFRCPCDVAGSITSALTDCAGTPGSGAVTINGATLA